MTNEKFKKVAQDEAEITNGKMKHVDTPADWRQVRPAIMEFVENMDELVEVYELENGNKDAK